MTITLGGIVIGKNFYLSGLESAPNVAYEQKRALDGSSVVVTSSLSGGRTMKLGTQNSDGVTIGIWCMDIIYTIKDIEQAAVPVILDYNGDVYTAIVAETDFTPLHSWEPEHPKKLFVGEITLIEV